MDRIEEMFKDLAKGRPEVLPSRFWEDLNQRNLDQLEHSGYENFKQTLATNYFTWTPSLRMDKQFQFLLRNLPLTTLIPALIQGFTGPVHPYFNWKKTISYNLVTNLLWRYAERQPGASPLLAKVGEPMEGNPPRVQHSGRLISQDIANSVLEYLAVTSSIKLESIDTIIELGAGYGRTAYVFLKLLPNIKYLIVDIPPALYVSERYLSSQFKDRTIFRYRPFTRYAEVEKELRDADIAFLLPTQLELLPDNSASLFLNISSLHEMRIEQIRYYFEQIHRLTRGYFYFKQWKVSHLPADNTVIRESDYPIPPDWRQIYWRDCAVQTYFFEALFQCHP